MTNDQIPLLSDEIISQSTAGRIVGSRAVVKGALDRGELPVADRDGHRGAARFYRRHVERLAAARGEQKPVQAPRASASECRTCATWRRASDRKDEAIRQRDETIRHLIIAMNTMTP